MKADVVAFQDALGLADISGGKNLAHVAGVGLLARTGIEQVEARQVVDIVSAQRLKHDKARLVRLGAKEIDLVGFVQASTGKAVGRHQIELFHISQRIAMVDLHDKAADPAQLVFQAACLAPLVDFQPVLVEEVGVLLVAERLPGHEVQAHLILPCPTRLKFPAIPDPVGAGSL